MGYRGYANPWPGRGPFSTLPPWERPGWRYGRGACWRYYGPYYGTVTPLKPKDETALLSEQKAIMEEQLKSIQEALKKIQERLDELKK